MATIKSFTDLPQSKKLAEILPLESADMYWYLATKGNPKAMFNEGYNEYGDFELPCWSLAALLDVLPNKIGRYYKTIGWFDGDWYCDYMDEDSECKDFSAPCNNPIDACYELILKLNELNLL